MTRAKGPGWAVVTGASSGLGFEFARQLAAGGREVVAVARRGERLEKLADEARRSGWASIHPLQLDVTAADAAEIVGERAGSLEGNGWLVNNAGMARSGPFVNWPGADHAATVRLNCEALINLSGTFAPRFVEGGDGVILNVASLAAFQPMPYAGSVYGGTKAFVVSFTEALSLELRGTGVTATAFCPGPLETEIHALGAPGVSRKRNRNELTVEDGVRFAIASAERGRVVAIPGAFNRARLGSTRLLPRAVLRRLMGRLGGTVVGYPREAIPAVREASRTGVLADG